MSTVLGLDLSLTSAGIAILTDGHPTLITSLGHRSPNGKSYAHRSNRIVSQCRAIMAPLADHAIDLAVIEGPSYGDNLPSNHDRAGLWWGVFSALRARRVPVAVIPPATLKLFTTGNGRAKKHEMTAMAREWFGPRVQNTDQADAICAATVGAFWMDDNVPFIVKDQHRNRISAIEWPEGVTPCAPAR